MALGNQNVRDSPWRFSSQNPLSIAAPPMRFSDITSQLLAASVGFDCQVFFIIVILTTLRCDFAKSHPPLFPISLFLLQGGGYFP